MTDQKETEDETLNEISALTKEIIKIDDVLFLVDEEERHNLFEKRGYLQQQIDELKALNNL